MPFEELPHTADWCLRVRAKDMESLVAEAARGMNFLAGVQLAEGPRLRRTFHLSAADPEGLLVGFLSELVYAAEQERRAFDRFDLEIQTGRLHASLEGAPILRQNKTIKAVTYHNLSIRQTPDGCQVEIVFDV
jgi:SHS2 domain-containing protein